jgi:hypothetical protein
VLIWVEGEAELARDPDAGANRGMIFVAHDSVQNTTGESFVISYPVDTGDDGQHIAAVSGVLEAMGWSVLASRRGSTAGGYLSTVVLVSIHHPGSKQRLWLAEPADASWSSTVPSHVLAARAVHAGGAGGDVAS